MINRQRKYGLWLALLATVLVCGCGIKPGHLSPPEGADANNFPRKYPSQDER